MVAAFVKTVHHPRSGKITLEGDAGPDGTLPGSRAGAGRGAPAPGARGDRRSA